MRVVPQAAVFHAEKQRLNKIDTDDYYACPGFLLCDSSPAVRARVDGLAVQQPGVLHRDTAKVAARRLPATH